MRSSKDTPALGNDLLRSTPLAESPRKQHIRVNTLATPLKSSSPLAQSDSTQMDPINTTKPVSPQILEDDLSLIDTRELEYIFLAASTIAWKRLAAKQLAHNYFVGKNGIRSLSLAHKFAKTEIELIPLEELRYIFIEPTLTDSIDSLRNQKFNLWKKQQIAERLANELKDEAKRKKFSELNEKLKKKYEDLKHPAGQTALDNLFDKVYHLIKEAFGWFNAPRLAFSRFNTFLSGMGRSLLKTPELKIIARCLGLYFLIELIVEGAQIINHLFLHDKEKHESGSFWQRINTRFYHVMRHDDRWYRVINAIASLAINTIGLVISIIAPPAAPLIFIILAVLMGTSDLSIEVGLLASNLGIQNSIFNRLRPHQNNRAMKDTQEKMIEKRAELFINRAYVISLMSLLVAGAIVASIFPPLTPIYLVGAISALFFGSVLLGLGRKLFMLIVEKVDFVANNIFNPIYGRLKQGVISLLTPEPNLANTHEYTPIPSEPIHNSTSSLLVLEQVTNNDSETKNLFSNECPDDHRYTTSLLKVEKENNSLSKSPSAQSLTEYAADSKKIKQLCQNSIHKSPSSGTLFKYDPDFAALIQPDNKQKPIPAVS